MSINFFYIVVAVIILIGVCDVLFGDYEIGNSDIYKDDEPNTVIMRLNSEFIETDIQSVIIYLHLLKANLTNLSKSNITSGHAVREVDQLINACTADLAEFKIANNFEDDSDLKIDPHLAYNLYGSQYDNNVSMSDTFSDAQYEMYKMLNLVIDVQIVMLLLENGICYGQLKLDNLHNLIKKYGTLAHNEEYISYNEFMEHLGFGNLDGRINVHAAKKNLYPGKERSYEGDIYINDENNYVNMLTKDYGVPDLYKPAEKVAKRDISQNKDRYISDLLIPLFGQKVDKRTVERSANNTSHNTQYLYDSGLTALIKRNHIQNYVPLCDINKIKTDIEKMKAPLLDAMARRSLRNDY